jgi:hypothetical protein
VLIGTPAQAIQDGTFLATVGAASLLTFVVEPVDSRLYNAPSWCSTLPVLRCSASTEWSPRLITA